MCDIDEDPPCRSLDATQMSMVPDPPEASSICSGSGGNTKTDISIV